MELDDLLDELAKPFDPGRVCWKPQATHGNRALAVAYADARTYQDRLNEVAGADWSDDYQVLGDGAVVLCRLSVRATRIRRPRPWCRRSSAPA